MKDITLLFCFCLAIVLGIASLNPTLDRLANDAARRASHDLPGFFSSLETASASARQAGKPLVVVFARREDPETQRLKTELLNSSAVNAIKERFVWAFLDASQARNREAALRYEILTTPATCVLGTDGSLRQHILGISMPYLYVRQLQRAAGDPDSLLNRASIPVHE